MRPDLLLLLLLRVEPNIEVAQRAKLEHVRGGWDRDPIDTNNKKSVPVSRNESTIGGRIV